MIYGHSQFLLTLPFQMPCELIEQSFFLSFFLLLSRANLFMALHFLPSCFGICDLSIYILVGCEVCAVSQFWCFKLSNYDKWWGYHRHPDRLHFHMVMPADRLFTRKYLKYLFPKAHIEMARYTIHDSSEWVYWIFCQFCVVSIERGFVLSCPFDVLLLNEDVSLRNVTRVFS